LVLHFKFWFKCFCCSIIIYINNIYWRCLNVTKSWKSFLELPTLRFRTSSGTILFNSLLSMSYTRKPFNNAFCGSEPCSTNALTHQFELCPFRYSNTTFIFLYPCNANALIILKIGTQCVRVACHKNHRNYIYKAILQ
jgi:hypothetical protein